MWGASSWTPPTGRPGRSRVRQRVRSSARSPRERPRTSTARSRRRRPRSRRWSDSTPKDRMTALLALAAIVEENAEELGRIESENVGKPLRRDHVGGGSGHRRSVPVLRRRGARFLEGRAAGEYMQGFTSILRREPIGIAGLIAPWNYPLYMAAWKIGPALAAGNCVVIKPSEMTPMTLVRFAELVAEKEVFPPGVFNVVTGDGVPVGERIVDAPRHRDRVAHRRDVDRQADLEARGRHAEADAPRAGRQGAGHHLRRRRPVDGRRVDQDRRVLQLRSGLHGGARACWPAGRPTRACSPSSCPQVESMKVGDIWAKRTRRWGPSSPRSSSSACPGSWIGRRTPARRC